MDRRQQIKREMERAQRFWRARMRAKRINKNNRERAGHK